MHNVSAKLSLCTHLHTPQTPQSLPVEALQRVTPVTFLDKAVVARSILVSVVQYTSRRHAISAGAPSLLVVALHRFRKAVVHYKPDVGFVNAHAESNGGTHDRHKPLRPGCLCFFALLRFKPCVVG